MAGWKNIFKKCIAVVGAAGILILSAAFLNTLSVNASEIQTETGQDDRAATDKMISWLGEQLEEGMLTTESDIRSAIALGEEKFGVTIPDEMTEALVKVVEQVQSVGLGSDFLLERAAELWEEYGGHISMHAAKGFWEKLWDAVCGFFVSVWEFIVDFVKGFIKVIFG